MRGSWYCAALCVLSAVAVGAAVEAAGAQDRSSRGKVNIILYVVDDLGFADLSLKGTAPRTAGGYARDHSTPNIDVLASEGLILDAYYVNRLCSPTRTSLISSRFAYNLGLAGGVITNGFPVALRLNETCIAQHMKAIGYISSQQCLL